MAFVSISKCNSFPIEPLVDRRQLKVHSARCVWPLRQPTASRDDCAPVQDARRSAEPRPQLEHGANTAIHGDPAQPGHQAAASGRAPLGSGA